MSIVISMLRGVNVGGNRKIKMETLRALYASLGLLDVQTYVQSGNVVFRTKEKLNPPEKKLPALARRIEDAIEREVGFRPDVIQRTTAELRDALARNPFVKQAEQEPSKLLVVFLASEPATTAVPALQMLPETPEKMHLHGRELYIYFPNGMARPKLSMAQVERALKTSWTGRNWNTATKLLEMAQGMEG